MKPIISSNIIIIFLLFFLQPGSADKSTVIISGDNSRTRSETGEDGKKIFITELTGRPVIKTDNKELHADKIISRGDVAEALGNVILVDNAKGSRINAARAVFYKEKNIIEFHGKPDAVLRREDDNSIIKIHAEMIKYDNNSDAVEAFGKVKLKDEKNDMLIYSEKAVYNKKNKTALFTGDPKITRGEDVYSAADIFYYIDKKIITLEKNAAVQTYSEEKDNETNRIKKERINVMSDRIEHYTEGDKRTIVEGNAEIVREDSVTKGDKFEMKGEGSSQEITGLNVRINYKKENMDAAGKYFKSYGKDGYSSLWDNASMTFRDNSGKETSKVFGDYIEYYKDIDELYVSGKVRVVREDGIIKGDMARYKRPDSLLRVLGNARIEKANSIVLTQEISINTKSNETMLHGDIRGSAMRSMASGARREAH
jgi:lipopolysaccharide assembly outer membrane protein LptD (OstA)